MNDQPTPLTDTTIDDVLPVLEEITSFEAMMRSKINDLALSEFADKERLDVAKQQLDGVIFEMRMAFRLR